jgi:hypothetical protein
MTSVLLGTAVLALLSGTTPSLTPQASSGNPTVAQAPGHSGPMMSACPMNVPGTKVSAIDSANGETLVFTTTGDTAALRSQVRSMAEMHNQHQSAGGTHDGMMGGGMAGGMMGGSKGMEGKVMMPPSKATVVDVQNGASIALTPIAPADLQQLQAAVRTHAQHMQQNGCGKMAHAQEG